MVVVLLVLFYHWKYSYHEKHIFMLTFDIFDYNLLSVLMGTLRGSRYKNVNGEILLLFQVHWIWQYKNKKCKTNALTITVYKTILSYII